MTLAHQLTAAPCADAAERAGDQPTLAGHLSAVSSIGCLGYARAPGRARGLASVPASATGPPAGPRRAGARAPARHLRAGCRPAGARDHGVRVLAVSSPSRRPDSDPTGPDAAPDGARA